MKKSEEMYNVPYTIFFPLSFVWSSQNALRDRQFATNSEERGGKYVLAAW
jgi:hypothetical protein